MSPSRPDPRAAQAPEAEARPSAAHGRADLDPPPPPAGDPSAGPAPARRPAPPPAPAIPPESRPALLRGVRVRRDEVRGNWVLLAPERALKLDAVGAAVLEQTDGARTFAEIVATLAARYDAPPERIAHDAGRFLGALLDRRMAELRP